MINTSQQFKDEIYAPSRKTYGKVVFQIVDITATKDASCTVSNEAIISRKDQIFNTNTDMSVKYATFETDYFKLDGNFCIPPKPDEFGYDVGWWSDDISGSDGTFTTPPTVTINFTKDHSSIGLSIFFDTLTNEHAKDFRVDFYNSSNTIINTANVTDNTSPTYLLYHNAYNYRKIIITITKWINPHRRARLAEVSFGIVEEYLGDKLMSIDVLEDLDTISNTVSTNELKFVLDNQDKRFNIINPNGIYPYLQRRQKINAYIGLEKTNYTIEYIPMGAFYLGEWKSDEGTLTASFTARDMLDLMAQSTYRKGKYQTATLYDIAVDVLDDGGVLFYSVDTALQNITVSSCMPLLTHREALQLIAIAGMAVVYCDRKGFIQVKQLANTATGETISLDNMYDSPSIVLDKLVNTIEVSINKYTPQSSQQQIYSGTVNMNGTQDIWIEYGQSPCESVTATLTGGTLTNAIYYGNAAKLTITASGIVNITANGTILDRGTTIYQLRDIIPDGEQTASLKVDNSLISDDTIASNVANWILGESKRRFLYTANWRQNPALECGDIVVIEDNYSENKMARITKQEFSFQGYLGGKTYGKGGG